MGLICLRLKALNFNPKKEKLEEIMKHNHSSDAVCPVSAGEDLTYFISREMPFALGLNRHRNFG